MAEEAECSLHYEGKVVRYLMVFHFSGKMFCNMRPCSQNSATIYFFNTDFFLLSKEQRDYVLSFSWYFNPCFGPQTWRLPKC